MEAGTDAVEVTQTDYDIAERANIAWGRAINGPHVAVLAAAMARIQSLSTRTQTVARTPDGILWMYSGSEWVASHRREGL